MIRNGSNGWLKEFTINPEVKHSWVWKLSKSCRFTAKSFYDSLVPSPHLDFSCK